MNKNLTASGKISVAIACLFLLASSAFAQISLRTALDTDKDGKADFSIFRPSNGVWYINKSGGGQTYTQFGVANTDYPTPGDYDGDGKGDISVWRDTDGIWYRLNSSTGGFDGVQFGTSQDEPVARDYDGDGKTDVAVVRRTNGAMIWYILGTKMGFYTYQFGLATDYTAPGDYDGDGKFDLAIQRPGATPSDQANFYILKSQTNTLEVVSWGLGNDLVVPGDYDGDGKTDVAIVRENATTSGNLGWYILRSSDKQPYIVAFGLTDTDLTVQNDYDGDGKTDIAVWRDTTGTFYYLESGNNNNFTGIQWGIPNDFPVAAYDTH